MNLNMIFTWSGSSGNRTLLGWSGIAEGAENAVEPSEGENQNEEPGPMLRLCFQRVGDVYYYGTLDYAADK